MKCHPLFCIAISVVAFGILVQAYRQDIDEDKDKGLRSYSLYQHQGTAQAYKPNAPESTTVCRPTTTLAPTRYTRVATWPYSRSRSPPVNLKLGIKIFSCPSHESKPENCRNLLDDDDLNRNLTVEVWQARPDGTYSALSNKDDFDCRAAIGPSTLDGSSSIILDTYAPGSTGCLGGLGPSGMDFPPYGPPVIHFLIQDHSNQHLPLLVDVPITFHRKSLQYSNPFTFWPDWRGAAGVAPRDPHRRTSYQIRSWESHAEAKSRAVSADIDFFLIPNESYKSKPVTSSQTWLCPSWIFSPKSFFLEPISVCSAWLLDFFPI